MLIIFPTANFPKLTAVTPIFHAVTINLRVARGMIGPFTAVRNT
jgi:hypothetical protein